MADAFLGIDLGTTSVKAALIDSNGRALATFSESYTTVRPAAEHVEQDPMDWVSLIETALKSLADAGAAHTVRAAALTSQVNTHVFVGEAGAPLHPAIVWQDTRAKAEAGELDAQLSPEEKIALFGGPVPIDASHVLARMLWVKRHKPEIWEQTARVLLPKDFALAHLVGHVVTDALSSIRMVGPGGSYIPEVMDLVPGAADRMAPMSPISKIIGEIRDGPFRGVPMVTGSMDGWVGLIGGGAVLDHHPVYLGGTSEILGLSSRADTHEPGVVVFAESEGVRIHAGPTQSGGASQAWFCRLAAVTPENMAELAEAASERTPLFLPQLAGERAPLWDADLRGAFLGVDFGMSMPEFARAVFEGVAFSARHVLEALEVSADTRSDTLYCGGGGFRSDIWGQIRANVLGKRLKRLEVNEPGIVGSVCLAALAAGYGDTLAEVHGLLARYDRVWEPDAKAAARYDELFDIYKDAIGANRAIGARWNAARSG
ncbi:FGGY-family carbohydrate kinase [Roseibium sp. RKSG952]|uniref:xylulokinase n=1 Tax=Roseibium sp. RKSG952 TaxID=2529384 RepID=UPI0012BC4BE9|nr:FGGY-family carbohydrate kinase [Roseibium sp. RKSG952]MTH97551.1 carbohydrate kinase [Roseibium sp. RKSG952]